MAESEVKYSNPTKYGLNEVEKNGEEESEVGVEETPICDTSAIIITSEHGENGASTLVTSRNQLIEPTYRMYKWRWFVVATMAVLNISNAMVSRVGH